MSQPSTEHDELFGDKLDPLVLAIADAQTSEEYFPELMRQLEPILRALARRLAYQCQEDAYQAACIRVWRKIHLIDLERPNTAKSYLLQAAVSGIRDEVRSYRRHHKHQIHEMQDMSFIAGRTRNKANVLESREEYTGILRRYLDYIEKTGDMHKAHKIIGAEIGVTTARASTLFHEASRAFIAKRKNDEK